MITPFRKYVNLFLGIVSLVLAYIGIILPGVPAIPFILLSGWFFLHSFEKLYQWLLNRKYIGTILKKYFLGPKISKGAIWFVISQLWVSIIIAQFIIRPSPTVIIAINLAGILCSVFIYKILAAVRN